jgi:hypothetical protein
MTYFLCVREADMTCEEADLDSFEESFKGTTLGTGVEGTQNTGRRAMPEATVVVRTTPHDGFSRDTLQINEDAGVCPFTSCHTPPIDSKSNPPQSSLLISKVLACSPKK